MKAIKVMGKIDERGQLTLEKPLLIGTKQPVEVIVLIPEAADIDSVDDEPKEQILEDFRQAWQEAMTGQTIPVAQLWEGIDDD